MPLCCLIDCKIILAQNCDLRTFLLQNFDLRTFSPSGKFLRDKYCYPESFRFFCLCFVLPSCAEYPAHASNF